MHKHGEGPVRPAKFSIAVKIGAFAALLLVSVIFIIGTFVIHQQESVQREDILTSLRGYFGPFTITAQRAVSGDQDGDLIRQYVRSMTNIPNLQAAMFVNRNNAVYADIFFNDETGRFEQKGRWSREDLLPRFSDPLLLQQYGNLNYFWNSVADDSSFISVDALRYADEDYAALKESISEANRLIQEKNLSMQQSNQLLINEKEKELNDLDQEVNTLHESIQTAVQTMGENEKKLETEGLSAAEQNRLRAEVRNLEARTAREETALDRLENRRLELHRALQDLKFATIEQPLRPPPTMRVIDSFIPVYYNFFREKTPRDATLERMQQLYRDWERRDFAFPSQQSEARRDDLAFLAELDRVYTWLYTVDRVVDGVEQRSLSTERARSLSRRTQFALSNRQIQNLRWYALRAEQYRNATVGISYFSRVRLNDMANIIELYHRGKLNETQQKLLSAAREYRLFQQPAGIDEREAIAAARSFIELGARFTDNVFGAGVTAWRKEAIESIYKQNIRPFNRGGDQLFYEIRHAMQQFSAFLQTGTLRIYRIQGRMDEPYYSPRLNITFVQELDYVPEQIQNLASGRQEAFRPVLSRMKEGAREQLEPYYTLSGNFYKLREDLSSSRRKDIIRILKDNGFIYLSEEGSRNEFFKHALRKLLAPFKFGFLRIVLSTDSIEVQLRKTRMQTIDISLSLLLRLIFFTFLFSGLMVRNIKLVTEGVEAVGKGNFDTTIRVKARDELGQLADRFNIMTRNLKEGFRMQQELEDAQEIQKFLIPAKDKFPVIPGFSFAGYYVAQTEAGGDYYDVIDTVGRDSFGLISADVSGHGVASGLVMTMLRSVLRVRAEGQTSARTVLCSINPQIHKDTSGPLYATAFYAVVNTKTRKMSYACAGHNPAMLYDSRTGKITELSGDGIPLGWMGADTFDGLLKGYTVQLEPGHILFLYTDGLTEAMNAAREEFQEERLLQSAAKHAKKKSLEACLEGIVNDMLAFTGGLAQEDDISILAVRVED